MDKFYHFFCCVVLTIAVYIAAKVLPPWVVAAGVVATVGLGKELLDQQKGGKFCWRDLVADAIGIAVGIVAMILLT